MWGSELGSEIAPLHQGNARDKKQRGEKEKHEVSPRMRIMPHDVDGQHVVCLLRT